MFNQYFQQTLTPSLKKRKTKTWSPGNKLNPVLKQVEDYKLKACYLIDIPFLNSNFSTL